MKEWAIIGTLIQRDLLRFWRMRIRMISSLSFPVIWLLVFGPSVGSAVQGARAFDGVSYIAFLFPGILASSIIFGAVGSAISIVSDREFGFLKEVLVAPVSRLAIALGRTISGAIIATLTALPILVIAELADVHLQLASALALIPAMFLIALALSGLGVLIASRIKSTESTQFVFQFLLFPMFFLSGSFAPVSAFPGWLKPFVYLNPVTYGVDLLRRIFFASLALPQKMIDVLTVPFDRYPLTIGHDVTILAVFAMLAIAAGVWSFSKAE